MEYAVIFLPLLGTIIGYLSKYFGDIASQLLTTLTVCVAAILSLVIFYNGLVFDNYGNYIIFEWIKSGDFQINWSINIDPLSSIMLVVVTLVSALVHIYSIGYMSHDPFKPRFMSYLSLFTFAMLVLVVSDNFIQLFFGWEGVGLSSYLLIGFWYKKESANKAAIKAFLVNRIGDFGLAIGIFLIFFYFGTLNYNEVFQLASNFSEKEINFLGLEANLITLISLFLFIGAMGKSAQFFLHTWLPDAMEGPTPVSALIHAATMVTAGVFMLVRISPLLQHSKIASLLIIIFGLITALLAAFSAINQFDIKKVLAYSTISQLGFMFIAIGAGAYVAAIFHLVTHAFFKALLFLGAGAVIHSMHHEQDIRKMGGLRKKMPITASMMGIGTLAISGIPPLAGFWSKDEILASVFVNGGIYYLFWALALGAAFLTAFYMGRHWLLIFEKDNGFEHSDVAEAPKAMTRPLLLLGIFSIFIGFINTPFFHGLEKVLHVTLENVEVTHLPKGITLVVLAVLSIGAGFTGLIIAFLLFGMELHKRIDLKKFKLESPINLIKDLSTNVLYLNKFGNLFFVSGMKNLSRKVAVVVDGLLIDGSVNFVSTAFNKSSKITSTTQTGLVRNYVVYFGLFLLLLIVLFIATPLVPR